MSNTKTGWERERRTHFDEIVINYDKARWDYPPELYADICAYASKSAAHSSKTSRALEIGPGTGKATAQMLKMGYDVTAVEIGANMAEFVADKFRDNPHFRVSVTSFEDTELLADSFDLIYAASAFHWVDAAVGCPKAFRLLKSGGVLALFRSNEIRGYAAYEETEELYKQYYHSHYPPIEKDESMNTREGLCSPEGIMRGYGFSDLTQYGFTDVAHRFYEVTLYYSAEQYIALLETMASYRGLPQANKQGLYAGIKEVISRHGDRNRCDYLFQSLLGRKP